ncbi:asparagine synthase (glutamine-hydrolyzing) [Leptolyngbya sp. 'hensonii']|uniref:asparagine synthase (glutamine-hydrolyzing) n=1 Tax=Leptolyngbya sp. 'hensonii' TaxID=1922337 RepID=UPI00095035CE|nr:asparagine synthase (glutamine-hydrolyzing) [Leptolyngbya sp. 'hensonii']OLP20289.1 asparagine synthase (glutamine-hydrolyzing) [Leptolyngbya sp. 'hensonii']
MCGITGFWDFSRSHPDEWLGNVTRQMAATLIHRGPDGSGLWTDAATGIALGHRRLAIVDLSPEGHQPMRSAHDRYVMVFNGEIYNFLDLRQQLKSLGHPFRGHSDTEVMLASFSQWGVEGSLQKFIGMFAFALWDRQEHQLYLGRDRLGEKPLYYGWIGHTFLFASELKALKAHPDWQGEIDRNALALFLRHNYIPAPYCIYQGMHKLLPGTLLTLSSPSSAVAPVSYWSVRDCVTTGLAHPFGGNDSEAITELDSLLRHAVSQQMVADVPLGAFLSGGIDSSTIVALMQAQSGQPVKTFTIGFREATYNEADHAKAVAQHLGCDHAELYVTPAESIGVIPKLPVLYDEPFADASQIPTFLVAQLARQQVTVSLSGDGGDEIFGGYAQYFWGDRIWRVIRRIPYPLRHLIARVLRALPPDRWNALFSALHLPSPYFSPGDNVYRLAAALSTPEAIGLYLHLLSQWQDPATLVIGGMEPTTLYNSVTNWPKMGQVFPAMMYADQMIELPDDILVKVDRATMGVSLEARAPLLDHRVIELAWKLPMAMKVRQNRGKWLLRQVLYRYVPPALIDRPKMGFSVPVGRWLRQGDLRDWAEAQLSEQRLHQEGFLCPQRVRQKWTEHLAGTYNWKSHLWNVLMFQAWLEAQ